MENVPNLREKSKKWLRISLCTLGAIFLLALVETLFMPSWAGYLLRLVPAAWSSFLSAIGTTVLGFHQAWIVPLLIVIVGITVVLSERGRDAVRNHWEEVKFGTRITLIALALYYVPILSWNYLKVLSASHASLFKENVSLRAEREKLLADITDRRQNIRLGDPAYTHIKLLLAAFQRFRRDIGEKTPCEIRFTAPEEIGTPPDSIVRQFIDRAQLMSGCGLFGPGSGQMDPDEAKRTASGMKRGTIIIHTHRDQKGTLQFYETLAPYLRVERSYDNMPTAERRGPYSPVPILMWIQFGGDEAWIQ